METFPLRPEIFLDLSEWQEFESFIALEPFYRLLKNIKIGQSQAKPWVKKTEMLSNYFDIRSDQVYSEYNNS